MKFRRPPTDDAPRGSGPAPAARARWPLAAVACVLLAVPAAAQDAPKEPAEPGLPVPKDGGKEGGKKDSNKPGGRIRMGAAPDEAGPQSPAPEGPAAPETPAKSETEVWIQSLAKWPALEAKQASIRLASQPAQALPLLRARLASDADDWRLVCGVAATLGKIGDASVVDLLVAKLQDRRMFTHSGDVLDAIVRVDPAGARSRLLAQLLHPASHVVEEAAARLLPRVGPSDADAIRDVLEAGGPAARAAAVQLLVQADRVSARPSLAAALRDASPEVAFAAAKALAADDAPEAEEVVRRAAVSPVDRQVAYASLSLALRAERIGKRTVDDASVRLLLGGRGLAGVDPLSRAAAAVVLADVGYYHEVAILDDVLDRKVVPELIEVVAGRSFWPDLKVFQPLAVRRLQRLTGRSGGATANEWTSWWQQAAPSFRARRILLEVPADATSSFSLSVRGPKAPGGEGTTFAASADGLAWASPDDFAVLVDEDAAQSLARAVNASGILAPGESGTTAPDGAPAEAVVRAGRRERRLALSAVAGTPGLDALSAECLRLRARYSWQRYRTQSQALDLPSFVALVGAKFSPERTDAERNAALAELITTALDDARGEAWNVRALTELRSVPDLGASLGDEGTRRLLARLGRRTEVDAVAEGIVLALAESKRSEAHPLLVDFLTTRTSPRSAALLVDVYRHASPAELRTALRDERPATRSAALASFGESSDRGLAEPAVKSALSDADLAVRREAVRALGRLRCEWARADLESWAAQPGDLRAAAVESLGRLGGKSALPALMGAFASDDAGLRVTAVEALGATREPEAISAIAFAMSMDPVAMVREVASRVLVGLGTERAAAELRRMALDRAQPAGPRARALGGLVLLTGRESLRDLARVVDDPADEVAETAALELARWRDPAAVPRLLRMLESGRQARAARAALEGISLEVFPQTSHEFVSGLYTGWWETTKDRGPRGWLVDALVLAGIDDPALRDWEAGRASLTAVPALLKGLRLPGWPVRRACDLALRDLSQRSFGDVEAFTTPSESARVAAAWEDWWASQTPPDSSR